MISKESVEIWRKNWKTKSGRPLSICGINNIKDIINETVKRSYSPSVKMTAFTRGKYGSEKLKEPRQKCEEILRENLLKIYNNNNIPEENFIDWEEKLANKIRETYHSYSINLYTYGNAQKWINIAIKYLFSSDHIDFNHKLFEVCYLPIDRIIQDNAYKSLGVNRLPVAWSKCDKWQDIAVYEENIKNAIKQQTDYNSRLWWECNNW